MESESDFPRGARRARAIIFPDEMTGKREWYVLVQDHPNQWQVLGLTSDSPFHRLGYNYLWSQVDFLTGHLPCDIFHWWHGSLPDRTKVIRMEMGYDGVKFLRRLWQQHQSWRQQLIETADIPF